MPQDLGKPWGAGDEPGERLERRPLHAGDGSIARGARSSTSGEEEQDFRARAARLLGETREQGFDEGLAPLLARAIGAPVVNVLTAERAGFYLDLLYGLLLLRRAHELEPLHEDLYRRVLPAQLTLDAAYGPEAFANDLEQLEAWGCLERMAEALKIRGYKDNRRERFRWRLTEDAVALLEWLEARLADRLAGRIADSRDRLTDVLGQLKELARVLDAWRKAERGPEPARRAYHLITACDDAVHEISKELLGFRGAMLAFAARPYELGTLREILGWLERYVGVYLARIEALRADIAERLETLAQPRYRRALTECREGLLTDLVGTPRELRGGGTLRGADELIDAQLPFFARGGLLATLCGKIDDSSREVLRKMYRHLRELERRSARVADLRACIGRLAGLAPGGHAGLAELANAVVGAAHARFDARAALAGERRLPPLPRSHRAARPMATGRPLPTKAASPEDARALRAKRDEALRRWIEEQVLRGSDQTTLAAAAPALTEGPRRWLDVARAHHLAGGRTLARMGFTLAPAGPAAVRLGDDGVGLLAPDAEIRRKGEP